MSESVRESRVREIIVWERMRESASERKGKIDEVEIGAEWE